MKEGDEEKEKKNTKQITKKKRVMTMQKNKDNKKESI